MKTKSKIRKPKRPVHRGLRMDVRIMLSDEHDGRVVSGSHATITCLSPGRYFEYTEADLDALARDFLNKLPTKGAK